MSVRALFEGQSAARSARPRVLKQPRPLPDIINQVTGQDLTADIQVAHFIVDESGSNSQRYSGVSSTIPRFCPWTNVAFGSIQVIRKSSVIFSSLKFFSTVCQDRYRLLHLMPESPLSEYTRLNCIPAVGLDVALEDFLLHEGETGALDAHHKLIG